MQVSVDLKRKIAVNDYNLENGLFVYKKIGRK